MAIAKKSNPKIERWKHNGLRCGVSAGLSGLLFSSPVIKPLNFTTVFQTLVTLVSAWTGTGLKRFLVRLPCRFVCQLCVNHVRRHFDIVFAVLAFKRRYILVGAHCDRKI